MIKADLTGVTAFISEQDVLPGEGKRLLERLYSGDLGRGGSGWLRRPEAYGEGGSGGIREAAGRIAGDSAALVVIGIGGSYLGARAAIDFVKSPYYNQLGQKTPDVYFVGNNLSGEYRNRLSLNRRAGLLRQLHLKIRRDHRAVPSPSGFLKASCRQSTGRTARKRGFMSRRTRRRGSSGRWRPARGICRFRSPATSGGVTAYSQPSGCCQRRWPGSTSTR